ncbi:MAG: YraN family protein [Lachnospiraceae bacterium]|nr:YraN family protein [Lachnospiraceae bacterium]
MNKREIGTAFEQEACRFLRDKGMEIICTNYTCKAGEIDIIARDGQYLVFCEVKFRSSGKAGGAFYAISKAKMDRITKAARWFMNERHISQNTFCRFDAVLIDGNEISHVANAW